MKRLRELLFIQTKKGASGEFHYVLLVNPNAAVEWMRSHGWVQDELYGRFIDRVSEVGAYGGHESWKVAAANAAAEAEKTAATAAAMAKPAEDVV